MFEIQRAGEGDDYEKRNQGERRQEKEAKTGNVQIMLLTYVVVGVFLCLIGYFSWFMVAKSEKVINHPSNTLHEALAKKIRKGKILSSDHKVLAKTKTDSGGQDTREYPYGKMFCHVVGRNSNSMTGLERAFCYTMLRSHISPVSQLVDTFRGEKSPGDNIVTTLDYGLQRAAYDALGEHKGAVVAIEPATGKILAMVSKPAYDPNTVSADWDSLVNEEDEDSKLVNRATQGLYPPGSTFKIMTAMEYLLENPGKSDSFSYLCKGSDSFSGNVINCYNKEQHGTLSLESAFAKSCNGAFAKIGTELNLTRFKKLTERFYFNKSLSVDFEYNKSRFSLNKNSDMGEITQTAIGQGKTLITPLENALIAATIANGGVMMTPYLVDHVESDTGDEVKAFEPEEKGTPVKKEVAEKIAELMKGVVKNGTGSSLGTLSYEVAGKTGSAEFDSEGTSHAWFVGYAPADQPKIAVSVVAEGAGTGSQYAVPIAKSMFEAYLGH